MPQFQYATEEIRDAVRQLKRLGLCAQWPDPAKRTGFIPKPIEMMRLEEARQRIREGGASTAPIDALQERIDVILDQVSKGQKAKVAEVVLFALGTSFDEIEQMRQHFVQPSYVVWETVVEDGEERQVSRTIPAQVRPRMLDSERRQKGSIFAL